MPDEKKRMVDIPAIIIFIVLMVINVGIAIYAVVNGQSDIYLTYIHNIINPDAHVDSIDRLTMQMFDELYQARFKILCFIFFALLYTISIISELKKVRLVVYCGILCEAILSIASVVTTIFISQTPVHKGFNLETYILFPLVGIFFIVKILALKKIGLPILSIILRESYRVISTYWFGVLVMFFINILALSLAILQLYIYCQLMSTSLEPLYDQVNTEYGSPFEISKFLLVSIPKNIYVFQAINIFSFIWLNNTVWYFAYVFFSRIFADLYQNSKENCNYSPVRTMLDKLKTILRYHMGTIIYAASPCAFLIQLPVMCKYAWKSEYLRQNPFIGSIFWLITVCNLPKTGMVLCSFHGTSFKQSAKLVGRIFIRNPVRLVSIYALLIWLYLFVTTLVMFGTLGVYLSYLDNFTNESPSKSSAPEIVIMLGAAAMANIVCQLFNIAILSIYVFMVQETEEASYVENMKLVDHVIEKIITENHNNTLNTIGKY